MEKFKLKNARISYANIFEKRSIKGGKERYSCQIILPKDHPQFKEIEKVIVKVAKEKFGDSFKGSKWPAKLHNPIRDGEEFESEDNYADVYEGNVFFNAGNDNRPLVIDRDKTPLSADDNVVYSGCYCNFVLNFFAFDAGTNKGVGVGLQGVQFKKDGDALSGSYVSVDDFDEEDFEDDEDDYLEY